MRRKFIVVISYGGAYYMIEKLSVDGGVVSIWTGTANSEHTISRMKFDE